MVDIPENFNAAEYFIDRHTEQGRGRKIAIECGSERVRYDELSSNVNRAGNAFRSMTVGGESPPLRFSYSREPSASATSMAI